MKLTIERAALLRSLSHVQSVVERRNTIPILSNVKLAADGGALSLTATDMDIDIVETTDAQVVSDGETTAPAHTLYDIVRRLPEGSQVELETAGETLTLKSGRSKFSLPCLPTEDFPATSDADLPHSFELAAADLRALIDRTHFAISTEETRYYLNGIYLHAAESDGEPVLRAVATDGHRLARVETPQPAGAGDMPGVIVPRKTVAELRKLIDETGTTVSIGLSDTRIRFAFDKAVLSSKLIDGTFPDYQRVIPQDNDKRMNVDRKTLVDAAGRVSAISTEKSRAIKLEVSPSTLVLSATSPDNGSATEEVEVGYESSAIEIGFNSRYMLDILDQVKGEEASFLMSDASSPTIVSDSGDSSALYVLMPMRV
jgi:DNA polymerase-3 subunit beta